MFSDVKMAKQKMLDIGSGLGGVAIYLARKYQAQVTGVEINPQTVERANSSIPSELKKSVKFQLYNDKLPFAAEEFDIVYSKEVLCYLLDKSSLFVEIMRVLKPGGHLIILDWLSPTKNKWSNRMRQMYKLEGSTTFAETEKGYREILLSAGFENIVFRDDGKIYASYNREIAYHLEHHDEGKKIASECGKNILKAGIKALKLTTDAIEQNELLMKNITATKSSIVANKNQDNE